MVSGKHKSRTYARKKIRTAKETKVRYDKRNNASATCPETGQKLHGLKRGRPVDEQRKGKSERTVSRPYGGKLSSKAMRRKLIEKARSIDVE